MAKKVLTWADIPVEKDGWMLAHNALRADLADLNKAIPQLLSYEQAGKGEMWMYENVAGWWHFFYENLESHHHNEEHVFFPPTVGRFEIPERFTSDHKTLMANLAAVDDDIKKLAKTAGSAERIPLLEKLRADLTQFCDHLLPHLVEEEQVLLPLYRQHFTVQEISALIQPMVRKMAWHEMPHFLRSMTREDQLAFMAQENIPSFVQKMIIAPRQRKFDRVVTRLMREVMDPATRVAPKPASCTIM